MAAILSKPPFLKGLQEKGIFKRGAETVDEKLGAEEGKKQ